MRRIQTLATAVTPDTSEFCLEGCVLYDPFTQWGSNGKKGHFSAPGAPAWALTPVPFLSGICSTACSLSCQGIFFGLLEATVLLTSTGNSTGLRPQLTPSQGSLPPLTRKPGHATAAAAVSLAIQGLEPLGSNYLHDSEQKEGVISVWTQDVTLLRQCNGLHQREIYVST